MPASEFLLAIVAIFVSGCRHGAPAVVLAPGTVLSFAVPWAGPGCALHLRVTAVSFSGSSAAQGAVAVRGPSDLSHLALACGTSIVLTEVKVRRQATWTIARAPCLHCGKRCELLPSDASANRGEPWGKVQERAPSLCCP